MPAPSPDGAHPAPPPEPSRRVRWRYTGLAVLLVGAVALTWFIARTNDGIEASFAEQDRFVAQAQRVFETIPMLSDSEVALLRRSRNARHVSLAESLGIGPPDTRAEADSLAERYELVRIATDSLYTVLPGEHSVPLLTPSAAAALDSIAVRFRDRLQTVGLPPFRFAVSSVWRTGADQAALRGSNVNAAAGRSSHEYATTFDITFNPTRYSPAPDAMPPPPRIDPRVPEFMEARVRAAVAREQAASLDRLAADYPSRLTALLGRALIELECEGLLVVVRERRQPVFHVTVARRTAARPASDE